MNHWDANSRRKEALEDRLSSYYGPQLPEQPLSQASWQHLSRQLGPRRRPRRNPFRHFHLPSRPHPAPSYMREAWERLEYEARFYLPFHVLRSFPIKPGRVPTSRVGLGLRPRLDLLLPSSALFSLSPAELDLLLATALARYRLTYKRAPHWDFWLFSALSLLLGCTALACLVMRFSLAPLLVALPLSATLLSLWCLHRRHICYRADAQASLWLGRGRVCEGLHALAAASRSPRHGSFFEPSLASRILRVCGTRVEVHDERLTLVR